MSAIKNKKTPEQTKQKLDEKVDQQMEDTFPASDPPSFSGGKHIIGAPEDRESDAATAEHPEVVKAEKKVKKGEAPVPHTY